jgi:RecB family exonuclease
VPRSAQLRSFVENAVEWHGTGTQDALLRLIRSPLSGVPHDVAAAYALIASRTGDLLDAIDRGRLVLPPSERDCVLHFAQRMRRVRGMESSGDALRSGVAQIFELPSCFDGASPERSRGAQHDSAIELADAVAPEPQRGVQPWQRHFSASALNTYAECQRKWFYKYACAAIEDPGSSASAYGTAFHLALEDFHGEFPRPARRDEAAMRARIRECITWAFERTREGFPTPVEFKLQVRRAQRTAQRYVDWLLEQATQAPFEVLGREVAIELDLEGRPFVGYIDRLDRDERSGGVAVVDYKTGGIARTAVEYCDKVRRFREFQLPFYYWAQTAAGDRVTKLVLIPLKEALLDVRPIVLDVADTAAPARENGGSHGTIRIEELKRSRDRMSQLSDDLSSGKVQHFEPTNDPSACGYCSYATACVHRPPAEGRRFGS